MSPLEVFCLPVTSWLCILIPFSNLQEFELILKDVVQAKRLSASKMHKLTEIALKSMQVRT